ncbi:LON peptidase substrate-binding domain-containing protein [Uliginosibacterium sediminicola]|uniref:LON peptidase substrate-binding domain-containing protein n=1 Tax=Uliginosibacterium sediminicola TaxID=2024550 RepID=A0ABU9YYJ8_9RHOO
MAADHPDAAFAQGESAVLPIFPLGNVLLPGGRMKLRIFEARYMDMVARCMQAMLPFGICLIEQGREVGEAATPHAVGVEAHIVDWDMQQQGVLGITVQGGRRFRIAAHRVTPENTVTADVHWLAEQDLVVPTQYSALQNLLRLIAADKGKEVIVAPYDFEHACWLAYRFIEVLPIPPLARLRLLELDDAQMRLDILHTYLREHGLIK